MRYWNNIPTIFKNKFFLVGFGFLFWLTFFDNYNFFFHAELNERKNKLESEYFRLRNETVKNQIFLRNLNNPEFMEKYAREQFLMKKEGEDVFILEAK